MAEYRLQQVAATGCTDLLVAFRIALPAPTWEISSIQKTVMVDRVDLSSGAAILQGRMRACYLTAGVTGSPPGSMPAPGTVISWHGPLEAVWAEAAFCTAIALAVDAPSEGLELAVTAAHVESQVVDPCDFDPEGRFTALADRSVIHLAVRLTRSVAVHNHGPGSPPPSPPSGRVAATRFGVR